MHPDSSRSIAKQIGTLHTILLMALYAGSTYASCGSSTACSINTDWSEHGITHPGWSADLRYSYSSADTLRSGSNKIVADPTATTYNGIEAENLRTINQLLTASLDYSITPQCSSWL